MDEKGIVERTDKRPAVAEAKTVAECRPEQRDDAANDEAMHQYGEQIPRAHQAAVEQRQPGKRHEQHERRRD